MEAAREDDWIREDEIRDSVSNKEVASMNGMGDNIALVIFDEVIGCGSIPSMLESQKLNQSTVKSVDAGENVK